MHGLPPAPSSRGNLSTSGSVGSLPIIHPDSKQCVQRPARLVPRSELAAFARRPAPPSQRARSRRLHPGLPALPRTRRCTRRCGGYHGALLSAEVLPASQAGRSQPVQGHEIRPGYALVRLSDLATHAGRPSPARSRPAPPARGRMVRAGRCRRHADREAPKPERQSRSVRGRNPARVHHERPGGPGCSRCRVIDGAFGVRRTSNPGGGRRAITARIVLVMRSGDEVQSS